MADSIDTSYTEMALFGIDRAGGHMTRFEFATGALTDLGHVRDSAGNELVGIEASAYIPGFRNMFAFWQDPADGQSKLLYVHTGTAQAAVVGSTLGHGGVHGAVAVNKSGTGGFPNSGWVVYALLSEGEEPVPISGYMQINPNNSPDCSFTMVVPDDYHPDGADSDSEKDKIDIGNLHENAPVNTHDGTYYQGPASFVHVRPKGPGSQNSLEVNGDDYPIFNSNTYDIAGLTMSVRVYNDHIDSSGKAMGKWHIEINATGATIEIACGVGGSDGTPGANPDNKLIAVNHQTGSKVEIMTLSRAYDCLGTKDGTVFYAYSGQEIYEIDIASETETLIGTTTAGDEFVALEFAGTTAMGFDQHEDHLMPISTSTGSNMGSPANLGMDDQGTIIFMPLAMDPEHDSISFD